MTAELPRLDFAPHWRKMNENLVELIGLIPDDRLDWAPREGEWSARLILVHLILARYHGPIMTSADMSQMGAVPITGRTKAGLQDELRTSWQMVERFISDPAKLDATYEPTADSSPHFTGEPETYNGHYIAYHRFAHDLHHRSTVIGHLSEWGISLDGRRIRPL